MARRSCLPAPPALPPDHAGLDRLEGPEAAARLYALAGAGEEGAGLLLRRADLTGEDLDGLTLAGCVLELTGGELSVTALDLEKGEAKLAGRIDALEYAEARTPGGFLRRLVR